MGKLISEEAIEQRIFIIRGQKVMLSIHLAELYEVETRALNQAVKRNIERFPKDFVFMLNDTEAELLVSQSVIPHKKYFEELKRTCPQMTRPQEAAICAYLLIY